jgi:hypothetical protein
MYNSGEYHCFEDNGWRHAPSIHHELLPHPRVRLEGLRLLPTKQEPFQTGSNADSVAPVTFFSIRVCLDPTEREIESAKLLLFYIFFALLDPNTPKCKKANATVILLIMD